MSHSICRPLLVRRRYTAQLQQEFADLSGDHNPIHVDPIAARRTLAGGQVVHGLHQVLTALEAVLEHLAKTGQTPAAIAGFTAQFGKAVLTGDTVDFSVAAITSVGARIMGRIGDDAVSKIEIQFGEKTLAKEISLTPPPKEEPLDLPLGALAGMSGQIPLGLDETLALKLFPRTLGALGEIGMAQTLALTRLVGMRCPGLHSLFGAARIRFEGNGSSANLNYRVDEVDERFGSVSINVHGRGLGGNLAAYYRPPIAKQASMPEVARAVKPGSFASSRALVIGGSRGLGEITAKIIAAGGGLPIITYHQGASDCHQVAAEIISWGGKCTVLHMDVLRRSSTIRRLFSQADAPRSLYYFATPKIGRRRGFFSHLMLQEYTAVYVTAFGKLLDAALAQSVEKLRVFYPSSVYVSEDRPETAEYRISKRAGEEMCAFYNQQSKQVAIVIERLPRIKTDQTSSLLSTPAEDSLRTMLPHVTRVESL